MNYSCEFQDPQNWEGEIPDQNDFWNFQKMICEGTSTSLELIENTTTGASFYLAKQIDYGDILIVIFLMLFLVFGILGFLVNFIIPRTIRYFKR